MHDSLCKFPSKGWTKCSTMHDSLCKFPSKGWTKCSLNRLLKDACDISDLNSESSVHGEAFRRASLTRSLISGEHDCVHAWRWWGMILNICCKQPVFFSATRPQKQALFRATHNVLKKMHCTLRI